MISVTPGAQQGKRDDGSRWKSFARSRGSAPHVRGQLPRLDLGRFRLFLVTFVITHISEDFNKTIPEVAFAITITLMFRPLGALIFGMVADRFGRRNAADGQHHSVFVRRMLNGVLAELYGLPRLARALRHLHGRGWGVGAALTMESLPTKTRGLASGILQEGYATGYLIAAVVYFLVFPHVGWRGSS